MTGQAFCYICKESYSTIINSKFGDSKIHFLKITDNPPHFEARSVGSTKDNVLPHMWGLP